MKGFVADLKHAARLYRGTPGASSIATIVVAVAMAFVGTFLSLYVDLALRPHPGLTDSHRLVTIGQSDGKTFAGLPFALIERLSGESTSLDNAVGVVLTTLDEPDASEPTTVELVTREFMAGLRPQLHLGRGFEPTEHDSEGEPVAILSYRYWQEELGGREAALGQTIEIEVRPTVFTIGPDGPRESDDDTRDFRIVGVMDERMTGVIGNDVSIWLPFERAQALIARVPNPANFIAEMPVSAVGRRSEDSTAESVLAEIQDLYANRPEEGNLRYGYRLDAIDGLVRDINVQRDTERQLRLFLVASLLLAFVAAANVSLFLLARAPGRRRELGIRMSVGAPMKRLARQLATESGVLVVGAALAGLVISIWLTSFIRGLAFLERAEWQDVTLLDWRVLTLVGALLLVLTVLVSLAPILGLKRLGIATSSREVVARATPAQRVAGAVQISIAGVLTGAAIAFGWYLASLTFGYPGYATDNRYAVQYSLDVMTDFQEFRRLMESQATELPRRREAIEAIPGVSAAAFGQPVPGMGRSGFTEIPDPDDPARRMRVTTGQIDSRYVDVLGLELVSGNAPSDGDTDVALVNQAFAQAYWGREDVVGEFVPVGVGRPDAGPGVQVVGVLEDLSFEHPSARVDPILFFLQVRSPAVTAIIESALTPADLHRELVRIADTGELELEVGEVRPLDELRADLLAADRARGLLTIGTATLVVVLAGLGFYGTQRYLVTAGRREYAIRASLGAGPRSLGRLVFLRGLLLGAPGLVLGALLAFIAVAWLRDDFVSREISPAAVTAAVTAGLVALLLLASLGPARQARRTQPAPLLREE